MLKKRKEEDKRRQVACIAQGDMNNYEIKQLECSTEQFLNYITMSTVNIYKKL